MRHFLAVRQLLTVVLLVSLGACANYARFQEADTLPKGTSKTGFGVTATTYKVDTGDPELQSVTLPAVNAWYRRGLTDKLEAHASVWVPLGSSIGVKYQLMGHRERSGFALSLGLDLGFLQIGAEDDAGESVTTTIFDTYVPVYLGYRLSPGMALYASPEYILRIGSNDDGTSASHLAGGTVGVALGRNTTFMLEGTVVYDFEIEAPALQAGVGLAY